jgi:hypothetical protein
MIIRKGRKQGRRGGGWSKEVGTKMKRRTPAATHHLSKVFGWHAAYIILIHPFVYFPHGCASGLNFSKEKFASANLFEFDFEARNVC